MTPLHPLTVHLPMVLMILLPILIPVFALLIRKGKMHPVSWMIIIGLNLGVVATGYLALETGENEEDKVARVLSKQLIQAHEEAAEVFVGVAVIILALSVAVYFLRREYQFTLQMFLAALSLLGSYLAYNTGKLGGDLVYKHGAASAYVEEGSSVETPMSILPGDLPPTNESLNPDETDYSPNEDELDEEVEEEVYKQED